MCPGAVAGAACSLHRVSCSGPDVTESPGPGELSNPPSPPVENPGDHGAGGIPAVPVGEPQPHQSGMGGMTAPTAQLGWGHGGGWCQLGGSRMAPAMAGQKQSSKVPGFLEKAGHKDSFVQLVNTSGPCRHQGCVCHTPPGNRPLLLCVPNILAADDLFICYLFLCCDFFFFSVIPLAALDREICASLVPPSFWGSCLGTWHPTGCAGSSWEAASPVPEWDGPWEKRPVSLWGFKKMRLFLQQFSVYFE